MTDPLQQYPAAQQAVAFVELYLDAESWELMRLLPVAEAAEVIRELIGESEGLSEAARLAALAQLETGDFRRYLAGRLGLM